MRFFIMSDSRRSLFPTFLAGVPSELLITYRFHTESYVSRIKIVSKNIFILLTPPSHRQSIC